MMRARGSFPSNWRGRGRRRRHWLSVLLLTLTVAGRPAGAQPAGVDETAERATRALIHGFDDAWQARDVDGLMHGVSPMFGCNLYGQTDQHELRLTLTQLLKDWPGSRCHTEILGLIGKGDVVQATVCRHITAANKSIEELCHVLYLRRQEQDQRMEIVALEEFSHAALACIGADRYVADRGAFRLRIPAGLFVEPSVRTGYVIDQLVLRGADLRFSIDIVLLRTHEALDLDRAFDADVAKMLGKTRGQRELTTEDSFQGYPAIRGEISYQGQGCSLRNREPETTARFRSYVYVKLDEFYLLAIDVDGPVTETDVAMAGLESLLDSLVIEPAPGKSYGETVAANFGWGRLTGAEFHDVASGLRLKLAGFDVERWEINQNLVLSLTRTEPGSSPIWIDAVPLCSSCDLDAWVESEISEYTQSTQRRGGPGQISEPRALTVGGIPARRVERLRGNDPRKGSSHDPALVETMIYVTRGCHSFQITSVAPSARQKDAARDLEAVRRAIRFDRR